MVITITRDMDMIKISTGVYAGISSRNTPDNILGLMTAIAYKYARMGIKLRSNGSMGSEGFFSGATAYSYEVSRSVAIFAEVYLPCSKFKLHNANIYDHDINYNELKYSEKSWDYTWRLNPDVNNEKIRTTEFLIHCSNRSAHVVMGRNLNDPVMGLVCWTKDGKDVGDTGQAIRIAKAKNIPIHNLFDRKEFLKFIDLCN